MDLLSSGFNVLLIILGFGLLIFIHELGHFVAAKWAGIRTEAFAVGMGPVMMAWRKGIGLRFGSTATEYEQRVREHLYGDGSHQLKSRNDKHESGDKQLPRADLYRIGDKLGLGETEYSLRCLPIGGFVKMLGQEDANPNYVSDDPRSYNMRPVGKRMIVVSAGVIMNLLLAIVLFIVAFMIGVKFEAPVVGDVSTRLPASHVMADNAAAVGVTEAGLKPGDVVLEIDGDPAKTFADVQIASAMSKPGVPLKMTIERNGIAEPLQFTIKPAKDPTSGLLSIGIAPGSSTTLLDRDEDDFIARLLERTGLADAGVGLGMRVVRVDDAPISTFGQLTEAAEAAQGQPLNTTWTALNERGEAQGPQIDARLDTIPELSEYRQTESSGDAGLIGLSPLMRFTDPIPGSANAGTIQPGDVLIKLANVHYPRQSQLIETLEKHRSQSIALTVLREGEPKVLTGKVNRQGRLMVGIEPAHDLLITAQPLASFVRYRQDDPEKTEEVSTPIKQANLLATGGTRIVEVAGAPVSTWAEFRTALRDATAASIETGASSLIALTIEHPTPGHEREAVRIDLTHAEIEELHALGWSTLLPAGIFEPVYTVRSAQGNPLTAIAMGFEETQKLIMMTYLTIDRLVRRSVGVDQLRGPVGIVHIGSKVADRGMTYLIFFLAMISVNLAVINFLPMPIVDGGLFLFLIYEKFKGKPPSIAFQNAATMVGLLIIGTLFVVTFYNDVVRLLS